MDILNNINKSEEIPSYKTTPLAKQVNGGGRLFKIEPQLAIQEKAV